MATEHNSFHTAVEAALNILLALNPCAEVNIVMDERFQATEGSINGADFRVECVQPVTQQQPFLIEFTTPKFRENGDALDPAEIIGYKIESDGLCVQAYTIADQISKPVKECFE